MSLGSVVIVVLAIALLVAAVLLIRRGNTHPWSAIVVAMLASGICFTVGGGSAKDAAGPSIATVVAAIVGLMSVAAAILALVPRSRKLPPTRIPILLSAAGIALAAVGLVLNQLAG